VLRLVTAEGTRAVAERSELEALGAPGTVAPLLDLMIGGRLLAADTDSADARLELIHESLISHWPSLRRWREDLGEHAALLQTLGPAAKQWDAKGRPRGMLWFGDELVEAKLFAQRFGDDLGSTEAQFVKASVAEVARQTRNRRFAIMGGFGGMAVLVAAAVIALLIVRNAQRDVIEQRDVATREQQRAQVAEASANQRLAEIQAEQALRKAADQKRLSAEAAAQQAASEKQVSEQNLISAQGEVAQSREDVEAKNVELRNALNVALGARKAADTAAAKAEAAQAALAARLAAEQAELAKLRREAGKLSTGDGLR
jgi:eukaryotic-like serine/threonine-protein kinase